mmetsp:Transcript_10727/g.33415  ORF Transcript_10727/g.33415 Transcript_10727/m.33415 type:complete len:87 (-) Transcript_10727:62-322(-)
MAAPERPCLGTSECLAKAGMLGLHKLPPPGHGTLPFKAAAAANWRMTKEADVDQDDSADTSKSVMSQASRAHLCCRADFFRMRKSW